MSISPFTIILLVGAVLLSPWLLVVAVLLEAAIAWAAADG